MNSELLPYNPVILKWAREKCNYSLDDIAQKFNKPMMCYPYFRQVPLKITQPFDIVTS